MKLLVTLILTMGDEGVEDRCDHVPKRCDWEVFLIERVGMLRRIIRLEQMLLVPDFFCELIEMLAEIYHA